jgi:hypothetical protein
MQPVPMKRVFFWAAYALGTLAVILGLLLAQVPRGIHDKNFGGELIVWGASFCFLATNLLLMKAIYAHRATEGDAIRVYFLFSMLSSGELCFCTYALVAILVEMAKH